MEENVFTLNLDESTTKASNNRVMNVLVCFFNEELGESITILYCSIEMTTVNADTVYNALKNQLARGGIPTENLVALLTASAAYMRGCHNGLQKKIRDDIPHLIDVGGDVCHHIHNIM
ncbi:hypothetical protein ElyMa_001635800 [Elysia marginata]|uniref:DUF4371 domain-containing protein n=1 Tax=Elysia marginata TaxID=1093978 RepID=A0AAV4JNK1_9GAST|nr:hypothetical protein ElyMa_001635800 [Elysia marginata]